MKSKTNKAIAIFLCIVMTVLCMPLSVFAADTYTITFAIPGNASAYDTKTISVGDPIGTFPTQPVATGKEFVRWYYMDTTQTPPAKVTADTSLVPTGNMTLLAEFKDTYTITFAIPGNASAYDTKTISVGDPIGTFPTPPTVAGKEFIRWYYMDTTQTPPAKVTADTSLVPAGNMTLLAELKDTYTITFMVPGNSNAYYTKVISVGEPVGTFPIPPTVTGKEFVRWYYIDATQTPSVEITAYGTLIPTGDITIYAEYEVKEFTISVTASTGGTISPATTTVAYGGNQTFTITARNGYAINRVLVDGVSVGSRNTYTFSNVTENHSISASFILIPVYPPIIHYHQFGEWITIEEPTCTKYGTEKRYCVGGCGQYETRSIPMLDHVFGGWRLTVLPAENSAGEKQRKCTLCGEIEIQSISAYGSGYVFQFNDVGRDKWYYQSVKTANMMGLINGKSTNEYCPNDNFTVAEALKLAACMNQYYNEGSVTLKPGSVKWYDTYIKYCADNGIWTKTYSDYNALITRAEYIAIFENAIPKEALSQINTIADNSIPDVTSDSQYGSAIYNMYRAGIVIGKDASGTFDGDAYILRCEIAAVVERMMNESARKCITLG